MLPPSDATIPFGCTGQMILRNINKLPREKSFFFEQYGGNVGGAKTYKIIKKMAFGIA